MFTLENFKKGLTNLLYNFTINEENRTFKAVRPNFYDDPDEIYVTEFSFDEIEEILNILSADNSQFEDWTYHSDNSTELAVVDQDNIRTMLRTRRENFNACFQSYNLYFTSASPEYVVALICSFANVPKEDNSRNELRIRLRTRLLHPSIHTSSNSFAEFCEMLRMRTVRLTYIEKLGPDEAKKIINAYLFNLSYNCDIVLTPISDENQSATHMRRVKRNGQLFPFKEYIPELIVYYNQGQASDIPLLKYLAYYHVAEFFFQSISEQDILQEIEACITRPSFSPTSKASQKELYKKIRTKIRTQKDDNVYDEQNALLLCLKKYTPDLQALKRAIKEIDPSAIQYYGENDVSFADGAKKIDFDGSEDNIYKGIRNRIYSVRNAIVHSKEGEKLRYQPFKHDKELAREIPLVKAVAEEIIINSSKQLKLN